VAMTKVKLWFHNPRRGDVVLIREFDEVGKGDGKIDIKRIAAVGGDTITNRMGLTIIPKNEYYVLGDNRNLGASFDSACYGPLKRSQILGIAWSKKDKPNEN